MKILLAVAAGALGMGCARGSSGPAPAEAPAPGATTVMQRTARAEPPKPADVDPTGRYGVSIVYGGQPVTVMLEFARRDDGTLGGTLYAEQTPPLPLKVVTVSGKRITAMLSAPDGSDAALELTLEGTELTGSWRSSSGDGSQVTGRRIP